MYLTKSNSIKYISYCWNLLQ